MRVVRPILDLPRDTEILPRRVSCLLYITENQPSSQPPCGNPKPRFIQIPQVYIEINKKSPVLKSTPNIGPLLVKSSETIMCLGDPQTGSGPM